MSHIFKSVRDFICVLISSTLLHTFFCYRNSWFHGKIARERAEELLGRSENGLFLVRESTNYPGDYTLCVVMDGKVEHYRIAYKDNKLTIDEDEYFENLIKLVEVRSDASEMYAIIAHACLMIDFRSCALFRKNNCLTFRYLGISSMTLHLD